MPFLPPNQQRQSTEGKNNYKTLSSFELLSTLWHITTCQKLGVTHAWSALATWTERRHLTTAGRCGAGYMGVQFRVLTNSFKTVYQRCICGEDIMFLPWISCNICTWWKQAEYLYSSPTVTLILTLVNHTIPNCNSKMERNFPPFNNVYNTSTPRPFEVT